MTAVKVELEIDSVAHPELYEMVAAIADSSYRNERMRQLASTGLIWERLRLSSSEVALAPPGRSEGTAAVASHLALVATVKPSNLDALVLPVLRDEVTPRSLQDGDPGDLEPAWVAVPVTETLQAKGGLAAPESSVDTAPSVHMSGRRSRLMRMKSRGLFTNE